jgi:BMFP domain-containing protein YqiC
MKQKQELATKEDLKRLATKEQLNKIAIQVGKNTEQLSKHAEQLDRIAIQVSKNSEAIDKMVTREEFNAAQREVLSGQDKMMTILQRIDLERVFTAEWISPVRDRSPLATVRRLRRLISNGVRRIEADVEKNKKEIKEIKLKLAIS